ncbi:hypothetical protein [Leptospira bourretii]|uniref:WYL domain-containing protein n=1 Tax=Leptospira bourretii TaxID=2484962 RepID=A0ABY2LFJ2_9LEPT|nr:hypothetical protein [Leptospira bourretii]TGK92230.1 hypothetical protein EHQ26_09645 [Leptospira bourretii]TGL26319.1 hypothetical protein EHQ45_20150 [Leptospira bourretii]
MKKLIESEVFYIPWLIDLAYLEENLIERKKYKLNFQVDIPNSNFHDSIPYPQLITNLVITVSFIEKGLKYLLLSISETEDLNSIKKKKHNLSTIYESLIANRPDFKFNFKPKSRKLFHNLLKLNYTNLRYLENSESISYNESVLKDIVLSIKNEILTFRLNNIYQNKEVNHELSRKITKNIKIHFPIRKYPPQKVNIFDFNNIVDGKNYIRVNPNIKGQFVHLEDNRLKEDEMNFIVQSYYLENEHYILKEKISIRSIIKLYKLFQKINYSFPEWSRPTLSINN